MKQEPLRVGLIGYGAIGQEVVQLVAKRAPDDVMLVGALVRNPTSTRPPGPPLFTTWTALLATRPHVIVEVAGQTALREHSPAILLAGIDVFLISVGALAEPTTLSEILAAARTGGTQARIVSGAIGALDALAAASVDGGLSKVVHTMRKPPQAFPAFQAAPNLTMEQEVFHGSARQAILHFPEFLNVAVAVALASKGLDQTEVLVLADPALTQTRHEVFAEGSFGKLHFEIENTPIPSVGRSARLVAMSILHALLMRQASLVSG